MEKTTTNNMEFLIFIFFLLYRVTVVIEAQLKWHP